MSCEVTGKAVSVLRSVPDLPEGIPPLLTFYLYLSDSCNLACRHCWITPQISDDGVDPNSYLDLNLLKNAIQEAVPMGLSAVKLTGGEPLLHPEFRNVIDLIAEERLSLIVETNGTLITSELAHHIRDRLPEGFISVSLDGSKPEINDGLRGKTGAFSSTIKGIECLVDAGFKPQIIMSVHRGNRPDVDRVVELAEKIGAGSVKFNAINMSGRATVMKSRGELMSLEEVLNLKHHVLGELQDRSQIPLFLMIPPALMTVREHLRRYWDSGSCNILNIIGILGSGHFALCGIGRHISELCFGKLGQDKLRDVWIGNSVLRNLREAFSSRFPGICGNCIHSAKCRMHCLAQNYIDSGQLISPYALCIEAEEMGIFPSTRYRVPKSY